MIPLIRPEFPNLRSVERHLAPAWKNKQFSNFGTVFDTCVRVLSSVVGGHALPVTSGTTAIQIALTVLNMRGKRVGLPDYTHSGTLLAIVQAGAIPVLLPIEEHSWTIVPRVSYKTELNLDCIVAVSPFGYFLDIQSWENFSAAFKVPIVYDLAGAFGFFKTTVNPRCYSFHSTKNFGIGEGGCVVFLHNEQWEKARRISNFGTLENRNIENLEGFNGKVDELKCASILAMCDEDALSKVWRRVQNKNALLKFYESELPGSYVPSGPKKPSLCVLGGLPAKQLEERGKEEGIICKRYYPLLSSMGLEIETFQASSKKMDTCIALPSDANFSEAYQVVEFINNVKRGISWT